MSERLKAACQAQVARLGRKVRYLASGQLRKGEMVREMAQREGITSGLIGVLSCVEPCWSFSMHRNRETKRLELVGEPRKCLHLYHYLMHPVFGFMHLRLQTWFPFGLQVCLNGREWLARQMDGRVWLTAGKGTAFPGCKTSPAPNA